jgi:hypothetical protein
VAGHAGDREICGIELEIARLFPAQNLLTLCDFWSIIFPKFHPDLTCHGDYAELSICDILNTTILVILGYRTVFKSQCFATATQLITKLQFAGIRIIQGCHQA